jgi:heme exporter protein A
MLAAEDLTVVLGGRPILAALSFSAAAGEVVLLTGPNGAGKTTLLRTLAGLQRADQGRVVFPGAPADKEPADLIHYIGHRDGVKPLLTVAENAAFWRDYLGGAAESVTRGLDAFDLGHLVDVPAGLLSAGQRRRLGLARLLVAHRPIWLLDEPTTSLDAAALARLDAEVARHAASGGLVIAATHAAFAAAASPREMRLRAASLEGAA